MNCILWLLDIFCSEKIEERMWEEDDQGTVLKVPSEPSMTQENFWINLNLRRINPWTFLMQSQSSTNWTMAILYVKFMSAKIALGTFWYAIFNLVVIFFSIPIKKIKKRKMHTGIEYFARVLKFDFHFATETTFGKYC